MPYSIIVKGSVIDSGGVFSAGCGRPARERVDDLAAPLDLGRPVVRAGRLGAHGPAGHQIEQRVADLVAAEVQDVLGSGPEARRRIKTEPSSRTLRQNTPIVQCSM